MTTKRVLGLDLGSNSIGWALIENDFENKTGRILGAGSRIIPMDQETLSDFGKGVKISKTAERTRMRISRHLHERYLLRRDRIHRVLNILGILPKHYSSKIDFEKRFGQFFPESEPKISFNEDRFLFEESFQEMLNEFRTNNPDFISIKKKDGQLCKVPRDWTIYFLRKKALTRKINPFELAWIILQFNQKRGYNSTRAEDLFKDEGKREYVELLKVVEVKKGEKDRKNTERNWWTVVFENGWSYSNTFYKEPEWLGQEKEFLVTEEVDQDNNVVISKSTGLPKRKISVLPTFDEIELMSEIEKNKFFNKIKIKTELSLDKSGKTVGEFIFDTLLEKPDQKIRGKLIRTIDRRFYIDELTKILSKQIEFHSNVFTRENYTRAIEELYPKNENHRNQLLKKDFVGFFVDDVIFYQRPLKSQKGKINRCSLEKVSLKQKDGTFLCDSEGGKTFKSLPVIAKSNPYYQEFRLWHWLNNLRILRRSDGIDVTSNFLGSRTEISSLYKFLSTKREVNFFELFGFLLELKDPNLAKLKQADKKKKISIHAEDYKWNYDFNEDEVKIERRSKSYPCLTTCFEIRNRLEKAGIFIEEDKSLLYYKLWHLIYSVTDKIQFHKALGTFFDKNLSNPNTLPLRDCFVEEFKSFPPFKSEFGNYSEKAIKKLLVLMRCGDFWFHSIIDSNTINRINKLIDGEFDVKIGDRVREQIAKRNFKTIYDFQFLPEWLAKYIVYNRHSEAAETGIWKGPEEIDAYLEGFKQHSLRNSIVEQVFTETLKVVRDIWKSERFGSSLPNYFSEIHIELGRDLKNPAEERKRISENQTENERTNQRIKALINELKDNTDGSLDVLNVRPQSPYQQEALKIFESDVLSTENRYNPNTGSFEPDPIPDDILKISRLSEPSKSELIRYKLWLEQRYRSPYTGQMIPLSKLFTSEYQIEHIIPQSRFFDDSFSNKVICEAEVNQLKDNYLGFEFIKKFGGDSVLLSSGHEVRVLDEENYLMFIDQHYSKSRTKRRNLLLDEIPDRMIERQLNDTRYVSKFVSSVLSNIVRSENSDDGVNSKNLIFVNGKITSKLKNDWGLNDVWNDIILPRFERLNRLLNVTHFTSWSENHQKFIPTLPINLSKGFDKKRIDHRHHALDAIVIACASIDHVNLLNNLHAKSDTRHDLNRKLRVMRVEKYYSNQQKKYVERPVPKEFLKPWNSITQDTREIVNNIIVSHKQNLRVIKKSTNYFLRYSLNETMGIFERKNEKQRKGDLLSVRKSLHKQTYSGLVNLPRVKVAKGNILTATRKAIDFQNLDSDKARKKIESITDTGIQKILNNYLDFCDNKPAKAFSPEGLEYMNKNITQFNEGKQHKPIYKARFFEEGAKFPLGYKGNKSSKYVEAASGTNLFYGVFYKEGAQKRIFESVPLNSVVSNLKSGLSPVPLVKTVVFKKVIEEYQLLFSLSPGDYVSLGSIEGDFLSFGNQIFLVNNFSDDCYFTPSSFAKAIVPKEVDLKLDINGKLKGSYDHKTASVDGKMIREICWKISVDRLGLLKT